jgi:hypothetical protein
VKNADKPVLAVAFMMLLNAKTAVKAINKNEVALIFFLFSVTILAPFFAVRHLQDVHVQRGLLL